jgi:hypothetical protein
MASGQSRVKSVNPHIPTGGSKSTLPRRLARRASMPAWTRCFRSSPSSCSCPSKPHGSSAGQAVCGIMEGGGGWVEAAGVPLPGSAGCDVAGTSCSPGPVRMIGGDDARASSGQELKNLELALVLKHEGWGEGEIDACLRVFERGGRHCWWRVAAHAYRPDPRQDEITRTTRPAKRRPAGWQREPQAGSPPPASSACAPTSPGPGGPRHPSW